VAGACRWNTSSNASWGLGLVVQDRRVPRDALGVLSERDKVVAVVRGAGQPGRGRCRQREGTDAVGEPGRDREREARARRVADDVDRVEAERVDRRDDVLGVRPPASGEATRCGRAARVEDDEGMEVADAGEVGEVLGWSARSAGDDQGRAALRRTERGEGDGQGAEMEFHGASFPAAMHLIAYDLG